MADIVKRLRHMAPLRCGETCPMCDGADEIERLRAAGDALHAWITDNATFIQQERLSHDSVLDGWEQARHSGSI